MNILRPTSDIKTIHKGQVRSARAVEAAKAVEYLSTLKAKSGSNPWPVIEGILKVWVDRFPNQHRSFLYDISETRQTRRDAKYGTSKTQAFRYTLDIPEKVMYMIRCLYTEEELPMNREFLREWANRFPKMRIAERI